MKGDVTFARTVLSAKVWVTSERDTICAFRIAVGVKGQQISSFVGRSSIQREEHYSVEIEYREVSLSTSSACTKDREKEPLALRA